MSDLLDNNLYLLKCALRLEEKAAPLPREAQRRAYLLAQAKALRIFALRDVTPEYYALRAEHFEMEAQSLPEGSQQRQDSLSLAYHARERSRLKAIHTYSWSNEFWAE